MRVLVVDDSITFRSQICKALRSLEGIEVVGSASNGKIALQMLEQKSVDVMTLDLNMPEMDGLQVLEQLNKQANKRVKVIVFASQTARSARDTIRALRLGASDFVVKPQLPENFGEDACQAIAAELGPKLRQFAVTSLSVDVPATVAANASTISRLEPFAYRPQAIVVASSTGGPAALEQFFAKVPHDFALPIFVAQHMPPLFTKYLAARLSELFKIDCREAVHGESVRPGTVYVAPGDFHMLVTSAESGFAVALESGPKVNSVRPAADLLFESAAKAYGAGCFGFVLTGMGEDGCVGARHIKERGGAVMIQDKTTSVVWGMPGAVHAAGWFDAMGSIQDCASTLQQLLSERLAA